MHEASIVGKTAIKGRPFIGRDTSASTARENTGPGGFIPLPLATLENAANLLGTRAERRLWLAAIEAQHGAALDRQAARTTGVSAIRKSRRWSVRALARAAGTAPITAERAIRSLRKKGLLEFEDGRGRVLGPPGKSRRVPICRRMARYLAKHGTAADVAAFVMISARCSGMKRGAELRDVGRCHVRHIAGSAASATRGLRTLTELGFLERLGSWPTQIRQHGHRYRIDLDWRPAATRFDESYRVDDSRVYGPVPEPSPESRPVLTSRTTRFDESFPDLYPLPKKGEQNHTREARAGRPEPGAPRTAHGSRHPRGKKEPEQRNEKTSSRDRLVDPDKLAAAKDRARARRKLGHLSPAVMGDPARLKAYADRYCRSEAERVDLYAAAARAQQHATANPGGFVRRIYQDRPDAISDQDDDAGSELRKFAELGQEPHVAATPTEQPQLSRDAWQLRRWQTRAARTGESVFAIATANGWIRVRYDAARAELAEPYRRDEPEPLAVALGELAARLDLDAGETITAPVAARDVAEERTA